MDLFLTILVPLSVILNSIVVIVIIYIIQKQGVNLRYTLILSLAVSDVMASVLGFSLEIVISVIDYPVLCKIAGFTVSACSLVSMIHLVSLSIEVCLTLKLPFHTRIWFTRRDTIAMAIWMVWAYGVVLAVLPFVGLGRYVPESKTRCSIDTYDNTKLTNLVYNYLLFMFGYVFPIACTIVCFALIKAEFKKMSVSSLHAQGRNSSLVRDTLTRERSLTLMFALQVLAFILAWTPYAICLLYQQYTGHRVSKLLIDVSSYSGKASTVLNPVIYCIAYRTFNRTIKSLFCSQLSAFQSLRLKNPRKLNESPKIQTCVELDDYMMGQTRETKQ